MTVPEFPPAVILLAGALLLPLLPAAWRAAACVAVPALALVHIWFLEGATWAVPFLRYELILLDASPMARTFGLAFALVAVAAGLYAWHMRERRQQMAGMFYMAGALGVTFAGDFLILIVFWELMAVASAFLVWSGGTRRAGMAGFRYLIFHLVGGSLLLAGIVMEVHATGDLAIRTFSPEAAGPGTVLILLGVLVNAGMPFLHAWLPDSYPNASVTGSIYLNAFTTKTAVYVLAVCFPGWEAVYVCGLIMAVYAVAYAVMANDIRLILSYHIISQVGFMVAAIGVGGEFALNAAAAHAYNNILYKTLMFMGAGVVLYMVAETRLTHLGGLARRMPWAAALYLVGAAAISGFPPFNGFVGKGMVLDALYGRDFGYYLLVLASVGTFLSVGIKLPYYTWFYRTTPPELKVGREPPRHMIAAMAILAVLCIGYGAYPHLQYVQLPFPEDFQAYRPDMIAKALQVPLGTFVVFWLVRHKMVGAPKIVLDTDWLYRKPGHRLGALALDGVNGFFDACETGLDRLIARVVPLFRNPLRTLGLRKVAGEYYDSENDRYSLGASVCLTVLTVAGAILASLFF